MSKSEAEQPAGQLLLDAGVTEDEGLACLVTGEGGTDPWGALRGAGGVYSGE